MAVTYFFRNGILMADGAGGERAIIDAANASMGYVVDNQGRVISVVVDGADKYDTAIDAVNAAESENGNQIVGFTGEFIAGELAALAAAGAGLGPLGVVMFGLGGGACALWFRTNWQQMGPLSIQRP